MPNFIQTLKKRQGFSLVEILVVITIIGVLATIMTMSVTNIQQKSRDSRRKQDLKSIQNALELAREDSVAGNYPICNPPGPSCYANSTTPALVPTYTREAPKDPKSSSDYLYLPSSGSYTLVACLEQKNDADGITDATNCPNAPQKAYKVSP